MQIRFYRLRKCEELNFGKMSHRTLSFQGINVLFGIKGCLTAKSLKSEVMQIFHKKLFSNHQI